MNKPKPFITPTVEFLDFEGEKVIRVYAQGEDTLTLYAVKKLIFQFRAEGTVEFVAHSRNGKLVIQEDHEH